MDFNPGEYLNVKVGCFHELVGSRASFLCLLLDPYRERINPENVYGSVSLFDLCSMNTCEKVLSGGRPGLTHLDALLMHADSDKLLIQIACKLRHTHANQPLSLLTSKISQANSTTCVSLCLLMPTYPPVS
eukprot:scaffold260898_cov17-Tisochrysis_lutea.AAC.1